MRTRTLTTLTILSAMLTTLLGAACGDKKRRPKAESPSTRFLDLTPAAAKNAALGSAVAGPRPLTPRFSATGDIGRDRGRIFKVVAKMGGVVKSLLASQGKRVESGAPLATLDSRDLADLKLQYVASSQRAHLARQSARREKNLYQKKITTKDALLQKTSASQKASLAQRIAAQKLRLLGLAQRDLQRLARQSAKALPTYTLKAPFGGTVQSVAVTVGAAVKHDQTLMVLADLSHVWGEVRVPGHRLAGVSKGNQVQITNRRLGLRGTAKVVYVAPVADRTTRTVLVRLSVPNPKGKWRPGCVLTAQFTPAGAAVPVVVPRAALHTIDGRSVVFVAHTKTRYEARTVEVGRGTDHHVAISKGLRSGERVATTNSLTLKAEYLKRLQ